MVARVNTLKDHALLRFRGSSLTTAHAAGIPTVVLAGLVYQAGRFWWHAWNASYVDGRWVPVDPIAGQFPADAGHIVLKIAEIERQSELLSVVGKLKIEVLEAR